MLFQWRKKGVDGMKFTENVEAYLQKKWVGKSEKFATGIKNQIEERSKQDEKNS